MGARSPSLPIGLALAEGVAKMWPPSHSVMQAVMTFRSLCPMKDNLSRCGWPPYIINSSAEAFIYTMRTGTDSILMTVGHMLFSTSQHLSLTTFSLPQSFSRNHIDNSSSIARISSQSMVILDGHHSSLNLRSVSLRANGAGKLTASDSEGQS